uniref:Protein Wnt n=1 Tax=Romanomermis culicivorax TaxID=13658 RepID=A0A915IIJ4_ROMCU
MSMFCGKGGGSCLMIIIAVAFIILSYSTDSCLPIKWLAVVREWNSTTPCPRNKEERYRFGLAGYQAKICREKSEYMPFVVEAAIHTIKECQETFKDRRWNCSSILYAPKFLPDLRRGTQEQAYVHALAAASLIYSIARACSKNGLASCPCGRKPTESATNYKGHLYVPFSTERNGSPIA